MAKEIDATKFKERCEALIVACDRWYNQRAAKTAKGHLQRALEALKREPLPQWEAASLALEKAAMIEKREMKRIDDDALGGLASGRLSYSQTVEAQKREPNFEHIHILMREVATIDAITRRLLGNAKPEGSG
jgi:hypothetical protein